MKLKTLISHRHRLEVAEVEIELIPGIPQIHFLGLPDRIIKESFYRIKSALKSSGYKFPTTYQVIVNIKPNHLQKSSRGVELAVALGILLKTKQLDENLINLDWVIYGELGLNGEVFEPNDLKKFISTTQSVILTGTNCDTQVSAYRISELKSIQIEYSTHTKELIFKRPVFGIEKHYSETEAELLFLSSVSGLHTLLAGDAGAGKSTLAKCYLSFMPDPNQNSEPHIQWQDNWYPLVSPHQSASKAAFIGGGAQLYMGEVERAQGGVLMLDELLEFKPEVIELLRGPMVGEKLRLVRANSERDIESRFQVIATTNLCPCGLWTPEKNNLTCRFSRIKCTKYLEKLSGPLLDRFGLLMFTNKKVHRTVSGIDVLKRIEKYNQNKSKISLCLSEKINEIKNIYYEEVSTRRWNYLLAVAAIYALEKEQKFITQEELFKSEKWTLRPFELLSQGMM